MGQIRWFFRSDFSTFGAITPNALKSDLKKPRICPIWDQSDPLWRQTYHPRWRVTRWPAVNPCSKLCIYLAFAKHLRKINEFVGKVVQLSHLTSVLTSPYADLMPWWKISNWQSSINLKCIVYVHPCIQQGGRKVSNFNIVRLCYENVLEQNGEQQWIYID